MLFVRKWSFNITHLRRKGNVHFEFQIKPDLIFIHTYFSQMNMKTNSFFQTIKHDLPAGLVVYLVALPLCLGIALASTGSPDYLFAGIIAGIVGGIVVGIFSGSRLGVSGPAAGLVTIVLTGLQTLKPSMESLGYDKSRLAAEAANLNIT